MSLWKSNKWEWGFIFPTDPLGISEHPSQLYESFSEGFPFICNPAYL